MRRDHYSSGPVEGGREGGRGKTDHFMSELLGRSNYLLLAATTLPSTLLLSISYQSADTLHMCYSLHFPTANILCFTRIKPDLNLLHRTVPKFDGMSG